MVINHLPPRPDSHGFSVNQKVRDILYRGARLVAEAEQCTSGGAKPRNRRPKLPVDDVGFHSFGKTQQKLEDKLPQCRRRLWHLTRFQSTPGALVKAIM